MSDTLFFNELTYRSRANNRPINELKNDIVDELSELTLTDSGETLGGAAEIKIGPLTISFNRVVYTNDTLHLKGPLGRTVSRISHDTDLAESVLDFVDSHDDIKYLKWEEE